MRIAIDAAGGDYGPRGAVEGAMEAAKRFDYELLLVGDPRYINRLMKARRFSSPKITVVPASEKVKMGEHAKDSLKKKDSSMAVATRLVKEGNADAEKKAIEELEKDLGKMDDVKVVIDTFHQTSDDARSS